MLERLLEIVSAVNYVLGNQFKKHLILSQYDCDNMERNMDLFRLFQEATEILSAEKYVTISFVVPFFDKLKGHLAAKAMDNEMIKEMKKHMLFEL